MLYVKDYFRSYSVDWLPKRENPYHIHPLDGLRDQIEHLNWIDAGEQLIFEILKNGHLPYVCASRGATGDFYGHALEGYGLANQTVMQSGVNIIYAENKLSRENFSMKYPEFCHPQNSMWRKCFDDRGEVIFIHRGRGTSQRHMKDGRGNFDSFIRQFNLNLNHLNKS